MLLMMMIMIPIMVIVIIIMMTNQSHALVSIATRCDYAEGMQVEAR